MSHGVWSRFELQSTKLHCQMMMCVLCGPKSPLGDDLGSRDPVGMNTTNCNVPKNSLKKYFWNTSAKSMISFLGNVTNRAIILQFIHWLFTFWVRKGWLLTKQTWHHKNVSEKAQNNVLENISSIFLISFGDKWLRKREFFKISCHLYFTMLFNGTIHIALDWTAL